MRYPVDLIELIHPVKKHHYKYLQFQNIQGASTPNIQKILKAFTPNFQKIQFHVMLSVDLKADLEVDEKDSKNEDTNPFQTQIPVKSDVEETNKMAEEKEGHPFQYMAIKTRTQVLEMWLAKKDGKSLKAEGFDSIGAENGKGNDPTGTLSSAGTRKG